MTKGKGWYGNPYGHSLASKGIKSNILGEIKDDDILTTFKHRGVPIAVVDDWDFWCMWDKYSDYILFDDDTYHRLSDSHRDFIIEHEIAEREMARDDDDFEDMSKSDLVDKYHKTANQIASGEFTKDELRDMWVESYMIEWEQCHDCSVEHIINTVDWHLKGTGVSHEDVDLDELPTEGIPL